MNLNLTEQHVRRAGAGAILLALASIFLALARTAPPAAGTAGRFTVRCGVRCFAADRTGYLPLLAPMAAPACGYLPAAAGCGAHRRLTALFSRISARSGAGLPSPRCITFLGSFERSLTGHRLITVVLRLRAPSHVPGYPARRAGRATALPHLDLRLSARKCPRAGHSGLP